MEVVLTLRSVSGFWSPQKQTAYANSCLKVRLEDNRQIKGKAVLWFNGVAFLFENGELTIPTDKLQQINICVLQDKDETGKVIKEWKHIETLLLDFESLDKDGERYLLAERDFWENGITGYITELKNLKAEVKETKKVMAAEILRQGEQLKEMEQDIAAIKNEPLI